MSNPYQKKTARVLVAVGGAQTRVRLSPTRLLAGAATFHLIVTAACYGLGRLALLPGTFERAGIAFSFARDSVLYRAEAETLSGLLARGELRGWIDAVYPFHSKLYSVPFALFGPWLGFNIVSAAPLNTFYYVAAVALVFKLGREVFGRRTALLAAGAVAAWPSFLLHSTQLLKDPLFVAAMLAFVLVLVRWLTREYSWPGAAAAAAAGGVAAAAIRVARDSMGEIMIATALAGAAMLVARQLAERRALPANLAGTALLFALTLGVTQLMPEFNMSEYRRSTHWAAAGREPPAAADDDEASASATAAEGSTASLPTRAAARVGKARRRFVRESGEAGSNVDVQVQINSVTDLVGYLPRAAAVGFFAPFPDMWLGRGARVGSAARLLSGLETLAVYGVEALALVGLWRGRARPSAWLLMSVATIGITALGLVVVNVGTLFRLRYVFLMPLIILAAGGLSSLLRWPGSTGESGEGKFEVPAAAASTAGPAPSSL